MEPDTPTASGRHPGWRDSVRNAFDAFRARRDFSNDLELDPDFVDGLADVFETGTDTITVVARLMHRIVERDPARAPGGGIR
jgi:hypothetical protein